MRQLVPRYYYNVGGTGDSQMLDGFWILQIETPQFTTGGVCVFINGKIFGGDNGFTWVGTYAGDDRLVKGRVHVHNFDPTVQSVLGIPGDYDMHFSGNVRDETITGTVMVANQPQRHLPVRLTKRSNL
jgi:T3SS negative regulator,GrlR